MRRKDHTFEGKDGPFHYIDWGGNGPLAHFAHATGLCAGTYTPLVERLRARLKIVGMDDRGHGATRAPADPQTLKNWDIFVNDLERFVEHMGKPVIAMGHSRGATVSMLLAIKRPDLIRALVLIDPTILPFSWMWWWYVFKFTGLTRFVPIVATAAKRRRVWSDRASILQAYQGKAVFQGWQDGFLEAYVRDGTEKTGDEQIRLCCDPSWESKCFAVCPHDIWRTIPLLHKPALIVYGAESDTFLAAAAKRFKANVPVAALLRFKETGHFVPMERPDETEKAIVDFLENETLL
ncbi:MAG: alpha/beta hydrolase [Deltaproteobacteria bacterium]|nr:alpha/beta hydrolase [Deltaproteobacteria bacterium]